MPQLAEDEARRRFAAARVARLATVDASGRPHQVPVVFAHHALDGTDRLVTAVDHKPKTTDRLAAGQPGRAPGGVSARGRL